MNRSLENPRSIQKMNRKRRKKLKIPMTLNPIVLKNRKNISFFVIGGMTSSLVFPRSSDTDTKVYPLFFKASMMSGSACMVSSLSPHASWSNIMFPFFASACVTTESTIFCTPGFCQSLGSICIPTVIYPRLFICSMGFT